MSQASSNPSIKLRKAPFMPERIRQLYLESFPPEERRPLHLLDYLVSDHHSPVTLLLIDEHDCPDCPSGFITLWKFPSGTRYIEHFATLPERRGNGLGAGALERLNDFLTEDDTLVIEVEKPDNETARRRIAFYQRCGFRLHDNINYVQPPYSAGLEPVEMLLMTKGGDSDPDIEAIARELKATVYNHTNDSDI